MRTESGGYLGALTHRVEVDTQEVRFMGPESALLRTLVAPQAQNGRFWSAQFCTEMVPRGGLSPGPNN
jgi:hypothetical protein